MLCVDQQLQIQALDREQPVLPMAPGMADRHTHTYVRNGTTYLFAPSTSRQVLCATSSTNVTELASFSTLRSGFHADIPKQDSNLVVDDCATHKTTRLSARLVRRAHWYVHFTPTSASWISHFERWFARANAQAVVGLTPILKPSFKCTTRIQAIQMGEIR